MDLPCRLGFMPAPREGLGNNIVRHHLLELLDPGLEAGHGRWATPVSRLTPISRFHFVASIPVGGNAYSRDQPINRSRLKRTWKRSAFREVEFPFDDRAQ